MPRPANAHPSRWSRWAPVFVPVFMGGIVVVIACALIWQAAMADVRAIHALPDSQRLPLFERTLQNLKNVCDPAATRSLSAFCHEQAALVLKFRECDLDPQCQEVARRHLPSPHR